MEKPAQARYPIHELLKRRWSPRAFAPRRVEPELLCRLLEAARWAASSRNEQPWHFILATKDQPAGHDRLASCLRPRNQRWARHAPVLMLSVARLYYERDGKLNKYALHDVGLAVQNLIIQATALDLFVHQIGGFDVEKARTALNIPKGYEPVAMVALGYPGDPQTLPPDLYERELKPRQRRPLEEFVFSETWGQKPTLIVNPAGSTQKE